MELGATGGLAVALEEGEEIAREESVELEEEVVDRDIKMHHQLLGNEACAGEDRGGERRGGEGRGGERRGRGGREGRGGEGEGGEEGRGGGECL